MARTTDQTTMLARSAQDPQAFGEFFRSHADAVLVFFVRRTFDPEAARDLMAETFAQAFQHRSRFRGSSELEATGWLYGIARHQLGRYARRGVVERAQLRRLGIQVPDLDPAEQLRILELAGSESMRSAVAAAFQGLPREQRRALELRVVRELPYPEVARALAISEQTARARVSRGLRRLAEKIDTPGLDEVTA